MLVTVFIFILILMVICQTDSLLLLSGFNQKLNKVLTSKTAIKCFNPCCNYVGSKVFKVSIVTQCNWFGSISAKSGGQG